MAQRHVEGPTAWQKKTDMIFSVKMGAMMGAGVGLTIGFLFGSYSIIRNGAGPRGVMATLSQYMLGSAASFTFFLSIGSVIRNDSLLPPHMEAMHQQLASASPVVHSRVSGASLVRARWEAERQKTSRGGDKH